MSKFNLDIGASVYYNNQHALVKKQINFSDLMIQFDNGETDIVPIAELTKTPNNDFIAANHIVEFSEKDWNEAKKRLEIIRPLLNQTRTKQLVQEHAEKYNTHISTIYRWISMYEKTGLLSSLIPKYVNRGGKGQVRIHEESELIMNKVIDTLYLHKQKLTPKQVYIEIKRRCKNANVDVPHENTVRNRIKQLSEKRVYKLRESSRNAERLYRNTDGMFPAGKYPLDVIQIDHTPMDIIIVDEEYRQPIHRPFLTLAIDVYSRMIVGFYIALEEPSYFSVSQCLTQGILPKDKVLRDYKVHGEWNIWGLPRAIHADNGQDFRSIELQRVCEQYSISIEWRPVARPQFGGHIERLIGTSMQNIHTLPGTTFSNIHKKGEYDSDKEAVMTLTELEKWFCEYVVNVYHKNIHSGIGMSPERKYEIGIFGDDKHLGKGLPERIENEDYFKLSLLPSIERSIQQFGVSVSKIHYYHDVLRRWIKARDDKGNTKKFIFKTDPRDISIIWFFDPDLKEYFPIPYRNISYPPISIWELRAIKQYLSEQNNQDFDETVIFQAYERMKNIQEQATTKTQRKKQEAKQVHKRKMNSSTSVNQNHLKDSAIESSMDDLFKDIKPFDEIEV